MTNEELNEINTYCLEQIDQYINLDMFGKKVQCPYYINEFEPQIIKLLKDTEIEEEKIKRVHEAFKDKLTDFAWYRGRGTREEMFNNQRLEFRRLHIFA